MRTTHDYTNRTWGHDYCITDVIDGGKQIKMTGWGRGISGGDYLILPNGAETTRYQVVSVRYCDDPRDMWRVLAKFSPREH